MDPLTKNYVQTLLIYLQYLSAEFMSEEILEYNSLYDHMHAFFMNLGLSSEESRHVIDDFRGK